MTAVAKSVVELFAAMGIQGSVVALLALLVVRAGVLRPGWQAAVWLVVLVKFVLPWGPALPWSLADLFAALRDQHDAAPLVPALAAPAAPAPSPSAWWVVLAALWLAGAAIALARALLAQHRVSRAARRAPPAPARARALLASFARRPPRLVLGDRTVGPHVIGILRPIIVIPPALLDDPGLLGALLHELAHVRRRDALARIVQSAATAVFFFWPIVRLASRRLDLAREAACDAWAIETGEVTRPAYARLLVRMARLRASGATGLVGAHGLDARVAVVLGPPARGRLGAAHCLALVAWGAVALGGARTAEARREHGACRYTPQLAEALLLAHPEADLDGDGVVSREEACVFQEELRHRVEADTTNLVSHLQRVEESLLTGPLCCNCDRGAEDSAPWILKRSDACHSDDGVKGIGR